MLCIDDDEHSGGASFVEMADSGDVVVERPIAILMRVGEEAMRVVRHVAIYEITHLLRSRLPRPETRAQFGWYGYGRKVQY